MTTKKRVNYDKILPKHAIDRAVGRHHVGTPDEEIAEEIRKQTTKMKWPKGAITAAVKYALKRHHANQGVYTAVMSGSIRNPSVSRAAKPSRIFINDLTNQGTIEVSGRGWNAAERKAKKVLEQLRALVPADSFRAMTRHYAVDERGNDVFVIYLEIRYGAKDINRALRDM